MFKPYDSSALTSALRLYGLQYDLQSDSLEDFSETLQPLSFSGSTLINPVFSADASILDSASSAPDMEAMGAMAALFQSNPATIFAQALFTAMVDNGHVFEAQSNGCACCGHDHGMNAKTQIMNLSDQIQQLLDSGLDISNFNTLIGSISALGDVDADIFANSLQETAEAFAEAIFGTANEPTDSDLPADTSTTGTITIGGSASGTRGSITDEDWYAVELQAGVQYTFIMLRDGDNPHQDPLLILYNSAGTEIDRNDDVEINGVEANSNSFITFTPGESGTYYLGASGWMATTGDYTIYAEEGNNRPDFTLDQAAFFLTSQFDTEAKWDKTDLTYDISALSDGAKTLALTAMNAWAEVSGLTFTAAASGADPDIDFNEDNGENGGRQAFTASRISFANGTLTSATVTISANWDTNPDGSADYALNSLRYQTYLHEVGHALGLGHSGLYNGPRVDEAGVSHHVYNQDAWNYTLMSYRDQGEAGTGTPRLVLAPQLVDIIAIQNFYGANGQTRSGDNVYGFNSTETGVLDFEGTFFNQGIRPPSLAIYDAGGTDTLDFSLYSANQVISLVEGSFSSIGDNIITDDPEDPLINNITIAVGTVIENAIGGSGDDSFIGNDSDNVFIGNGGNDTYAGGAGNDMVILALSQSRYIIFVDETNEGRFLVISGGTEGTDRINLADVEFVGFDDGQTIVTTASLADPIEFDDDGDGNIDRRVHLNADGRWTRVERDLDDDGTIDRITHYAFDDGGTRRVTRRDFDRDDDGNIDRTVHLNAEGRWQRLEQDVDDDGFIDRITHYAFDDGGTRRVTRRDFDRDDDGNIDRTVHLDAEGRWQRLEQDLDDDGFIDRITHYAFDGDGNRSVTRRDEDLDDDGNIDRTIHLNAEGRWERVELDDDDDGFIDRTVHRNTDTGAINRIDFDDDGDGTTDRSEFYTQNTDGNRDRANFDDDANGTIDRSESYTYNANGRVSQTGFDDNNDGTTDRNESYTYDANGRLIQTDFDDNNDGTIDRSDRAPSSLDGINGFTLTGIDAVDQSGYSVSSAGDVNGDGYDDLIIGANGANPNGEFNAGETYIVYGGASAPGTNGVLDLSGLEGTNGFTLTGIDRFDNSGTSVSSAGDVNGDGYDDLIIGANRADPNGDINAGEGGETYIVYGGASAPGTDGVLALSSLNGTNGFILNGIDADDYSGWSVSSAGDVNGDGYDDLIIGARLADPNGDDSGETYVIYGGASAPRTGVRLSTLNGSNGFILTGIDAGDSSGRSVSSAGDVNGDGYDDLIIGAWRADPNGNDNAGETYVIYGGASAPGGVLDLSSLNGTNGFILNGIDVGDSSGISVSSAGDVNGDGYDDLIIGAHFAGPNGNSSGETYIVYGGASAPGTGGRFNLSTLNGINGFILTGIDADDRSGFSVSSAGDVNGDGYDDLIIGAPSADPNGNSSAGETYVIYGGASAPGTGGVLDLSMLDGTNGFTVTGIDAYDNSGHSVSSAGDVNGDGYDDLIIGANRADPNGDSRAGETYIVYGGATGTESLVPVTASGTAVADNFTGNAGDDSFTAIATNDVVRGGAGNDTIRVTSLDFAAIDGGTGADTLVLDGAGLALDLTGAGHAGVDSVEVFDLSGTGANSLVLDALAVFDVTEEREGGAASLDVLGDADDRVELSSNSFALTGTAAEDGVTYNIYRDGNAQLRIETGVQVVTIPVFTSPAAVSARENQTAAYEAAATDDEGDPLVYSLSGTDANLFTINANTGEVSFIAAPDFEMPSDADGDNVYDITVTASDGDNNRNHNVAIRVTNENDNIPVFTSPAAVSAQENQRTAYEAAATDADGDMLVYRLSGTDAALFTIGSTTGEVRFRVAPDFEDPDDADGDNVYDINVTASDGTNRTDKNVAITVTDEENDPVNLSRLDGTNGFTLTGIDADDQSGASVSSAGDVNGDGYDDLIIGARYADPNRDSSGETYLVYGGASAPGTGGVLDLSGLDGSNGFILTGINRGDESGFSVSSAGDVNGDGYDDLIIGARYADPNGNFQAGETYIVYGGASAPGTEGVLDLSGLDGTNGFTLTGIDAGDRSGSSVSSAGDVNGDGYDDLIIGAHWADPNGDRSGETYLVYGGASAPGTDGVLDLGALNGTNGFILTGIDARDNSGWSVSSAGDVNGDGYDDLIIGARDAHPIGGRRNAGETYVVYGGASAPGTNGVLDLGALDGTNGFILTGIGYDARSGSSVSSAGDVNGDGYDDLIIGAPYAFPNGDRRAGETYIVYGGASAPGTGGVLNLEALDGTNGFTLTGIDAGDRSGFSVSSAGDVNGDGYDDLIIGARFADPNGDRDAGETYVVYGGASAPGEDGELNLGALDGTNSFILAGIDAGDRSGRSVSSAGDVNGDGYDDLIIGANTANPNGDSNAGETYVIYGGATGTESLTPVTASGTAGADNFTGNAGDDNFTAIATNDVVRGGAGNDIISVTALDFAAIDGGTGQDTLVLDGAGLSLDLTGAGHAGVDSVEIFDLSGTGANSLVLDALAVFDVTEEREGGAASLDVLGDADDRVDLSGSSFALTGTAAEDGVTYNIYRDGNAQLRVETGVQVQIPPAVFTSPAAVSVAEGQSAAYEAAATDDEGDPLVYSLSGTDAALFTINANTGEVSFIAAPDFEMPGDADGDNVYDITVTASDGDNSRDHNVAITVTNENDIPVFLSPATANAQENQTAAYEAAATDADGDPLVYSLSGTDAALFTIDRDTGEVRFRVAPDFEDPDDADGDNVYDITVTAFDGTNRTDHNVAITVTDYNIPVFTSPFVVSVAENQMTAYEAAATDDDGDPLVYRLSGTDAALFTIDANTGEVSFIAAPDFERPGDADGDNVYDITVTAFDGTNSTTHNVAIRVTNENDNIPVFTSPAAVSARENQMTAYEAAATDADGDPLVYSLSGTDAALFTIDSNTGEVSFIAAPDFEMPGDADRDNVYDITVTASDGTNSTNHNVAITVTDENIPVFTSPAAVSVAEGQTAAYEAAAADDEGDPLVYSLSGTDAALFTINADTGEVSFIEAPDFEAPGDDGGDNVYGITVTASDGTNSTNHNVAIRVTNENENIPVFTSPAAVSARENQVAAYEAAATDADGDPLVYSLSGTDAALFRIGSTTGEVRFRVAPDFERPGDADGDNVYDITVTAFDGTDRTDHNVTITVTDENDPINLSSLDGTNGFTLTGIDRGDRSGASVSSAGDVNGDGYDDLIIGAFRADPNGDSYAGETYIVYGGASAPGRDGVLDLSRLALDGNGFILTGIDGGDQSGFSVSSAGDVNGDGYDDLIIGGSSADPNGDSAAGETYVVYGGANAPGTEGVLDLGALDGTNGFILTGIDANDQSGRSVSSAGDVNGDGYDDLIIGAHQADPNRDSQAGETYIIYGGASAPGIGGVLDLGALDGTNGFILTGIDRFDNSGSSVSSAGDVNGDGYDDLIIGARLADPNGRREAGETYVVYGGASAPGTGGVLDLGALDGTNGFILNGIDASDFSGFSVSSAGDVNGDGYDDLIIGARFADPNGNRSGGETYVIYGGASAPGTGGRFNLSTLNGTNGFTVTGIDAGDNSGYSVSSAGDVNGDGYDDLIIGANRASPNGDSSGETYVVYGGASAPGTGGVLDLGALDDTNGFILAGIDRFDYSGSSVSSAGDVNGDGYDDLIIGADRADPNGDSDAGETYIVYGGATGTESLTPVTASGMAAADNFTGNAGADSFTAIATNDVVRGGAGDDIISVTALDFAAIDGGTGADTLVLDGAGLALDLTGAGHASVDSVEVFDLSGTGANSLVLDALAVFDVTEEREGGGMASLDVLGDADDRVELIGSNFALTGTATEDGVTYNIYRDGNAQLRIETGVQVVTIPVFTSPAAVSVQENRMTAYEAAATDDEGDPLSYSLSGTDAALFTINANTGEVSFIAAPDFEMPGDADGDNVYDITVTASDGDNNRNHNVAITVTNENDNIPVFTSPAAVSVQENRMTAYEAAATDADGDPLVYSLSGTDAALFTIDANRGDVSFIAASDFEMPGDADGDNVYDITVTASDGTNRTDHNVAITVTNDNIPVFTSPFVASARENQTAAYEAAAMDDEGDPLIYSLSGTDAALFTIDATTGEVSFIAAPDFEVPGDADGDNVYDITVTASDGDNNTDRDVAIIVTNENDNIPVFTSPAAASVAEGQSAVYRATATDGDGDMPRYSLSGTDAALFRIGSTTGEVRFRVAPDFERPGDADGDNVYDITVTASDGSNRTDHNVAITVTDGYDPVNLSSLDGTNGFTLNGIDEFDSSGYSVSSAGDVNGDGYDDLIIGASGGGSVQGEYGTIFGPGETYIVYGGANAPGTDGVLGLSSLDGTNGFTLTGIDAGDQSGFSVSSAGDINGDGYDDLIIGARGVGSVQREYDMIPGPGEAYVVYGGATGADLVLDRSTLDGTNGFTLTGIDAYDQSGYSVSSAGDVNGDGYDDLIIGARGASPNGDNEAGETYIVYGGASAPGTGGVLDLSALDGINGFILNGIDSNDNSGVSVSSAGDVNGDGYDDLIIGADQADPNGNRSGGETYIVYGGASAPGTGGVLDLSGLDGTNGFILTGSDDRDNSGRSVSSAGDVNGDGYDDLIIGASGADPNGNRSGGETYVIYGGASAPGTGGVLDLSGLDGTNGFILTGIDRDDLSGTSVSSAGDVNGDGYDDLIIGADQADPNGDNSGETYVIYGGANAPGTGGVLNLSDLDGTNGFIIAGIDARDRSGRSVSSAGDVNGDGYDDLIIGAQDADPNGGSGAGETYIVYGGATGTESLVPVTALGTAAADNFTGNAGDDNFTAIATDDVVHGGAGDDNISVTALDFAAIDGGTGADRLVLDGAGLALDLTGAGHAGVDSVEVFDLSGTGANSLVLDALAVFDVTEEREGGVASLDVLGDADDRVDLSGSNFALTGTATEDGVTYNVYRDGNAQLRIETGVMVTLAATGSQSARFKTDAKIDTKTDTGIDPVADPRTDTRTDPGTDPESGTRLDEALMNSDSLMNNDPWNNNLWGNDLWDGLWADGVRSLDQPVHIDEDAILIPLSDPLSFGPLASGPLQGPWGVIYWPGLENHPAMQNDLAMILPEMEIVTAYMEGF